MLMGVCMRYSTGVQEAEDILQDVFIKIFSKMDTFSGTGALGGWMRRIAVNTALEKFRKKKIKIQDSLSAEQEIQNIEVSEKAIQNLELEDLVKKIQKLPEGYRNVFNLFAVEGYSHKEIAEMMNITVGTSKSQFSRARQQLKRMIDQEDEEIKRKFSYVR